MVLKIFYPAITTLLKDGGLLIAEFQDLLFCQPASPSPLLIPADPCIYIMSRSFVFHPECEGRQGVTGGSFLEQWWCAGGEALGGQMCSVPSSWRAEPAEAPALGVTVPPRSHSRRSIFWAVRL